MAGAQWVHAAEYRREYDVQVQGTLRGAALGAGSSAQRTEARIKCAVLNRMTQLGMPVTVRDF